MHATCMDSQLVYAIVPLKNFCIEKVSWIQIDDRDGAHDNIRICSKDICYVWPDEMEFIMAQYPVDSDNICIMHATRVTDYTRDDDTLASEVTIGIYSITPMPTSEYAKKTFKEWNDYVQQGANDQCSAEGAGGTAGEGGQGKF